MPDLNKLTLYEEEFYETQEVKEESVKLVVFSLCKEWYGIEISKVSTVVKMESFTYLPSSPMHILGVVNLRGTILSVTNLKMVFSLITERISDKAKIVVVKSNGFETGILADEVAEVLDIPVSKIDPVLATISQEKAEYIEGECKIGDKLIGILRVDKILEIK